MEAITTEFLTLQFLLLTSLALSVGFLYYCLSYRQKRGVTSLVVMFLGITVWVGSELVQIQLSNSSVAGFGMALRILGIEITVIGILFLGLEYTGRDRFVNWKMGVAFSVVPILEIALALSPARGLFFGTAVAPAMPWGYELLTTPLFLAHTIYSYSFVVISLGLLIAMMVRANAGYRRQLAAIFVSVLFPTAVNVLFHFDILPFDLTPVSFVFTAAVLMFATFQLRLLDAIPVARRTVIEEMEDMVVVLDENGDIITTNASFNSRFGTDQSPAGRPLSEFFGTGETEEIITGNGQHELDLNVDGDERIINVNRSEIMDYRDNLLARVLVCRDVTEQTRREEKLRQREEELELLKDLQSRFLRHNLRNELNVVRANAELLADTDDATERERYETILAKTDRILDWSTKARTIERLVETNETVDRDVILELERVIEELREEFPGVAFEVDTPAQTWIAAVPQIDRALWNVLDNAARYNTAENPSVRVTVERTSDQVTVRVTDNGPGIEHYEIETLRGKTETQLQHGTGLGLWLVYWVVDKSDGSLSFDSSDGTTVTLEFNRGESERTSDESASDAEAVADTADADAAADAVAGDMNGPTDDDRDSGPDGEDQSGETNPAVGES